MKWKDNGGGDFEKVPTGTHVARCIALIDLGTRTGPFGSKREVMIRWELPHEAMASSPDGEVFTISQFYTQSLGEKANLRAMLKSWRGRDFTEEELKGFDPRTILGKPCMVSVIEKATQKGDIKHVVGAVSALARGMQIPEQMNPSVYLSLEPEDFDQSAFNVLSEKIQAMVKESPEYKSLHSGAANNQTISDGEPF